MTLTTAAFFLPISEQALAPVLGDSRTLEEAVNGFAVPHIAALIFLQYLPKLKADRSLPLNVILAEAIKSGNVQTKRDGKEAFIAATLRVLDREKIREGYRLLPDFRVALLDDEVLRLRGYLTVDGEWDTTFAARHGERLAESLQRIDLPGGKHGLLTTDQSRVFKEVTAQLDDHLHVQGYAGTGKSYLIKSLLAMLEVGGANILVLAERNQQLSALLGGQNSIAGVFPRTFEALAREMAPKDLTNPTSFRMSQRTYSPLPISDEVLIKHLGIHSSGKFRPREIVKIVRRTVRSYCYSGDAEFDAKHIPREFGADLDDTTRTVVLHHATELWKATLLPPSREFQPPLRGFHRVKWTALNGLQIPARYTHVLIDECHDLATPMVQIVDSSSQAVISLGDEYQNLYGRPQRRSGFVRQRTVTHSVRSGHLVESVVNPLITAHPGATKLPFHGNPFNKTEVCYYHRLMIPEKPATILVGDSWGLFEWLQRLAAEGADVELLSNQRELDLFVTDCLELYRHGTRPRHGQLFRFASWDELASRYHDNPGFRRIERMIKNGYSAEDWARTLERVTQRAGGGFAVGLVDDVRNQEFDAVMLTPELADHVKDAKSTDRAAVCSAVYVAVTRARRRLMMPERLRNWIEEVSARQAKFDGSLRAL